MFKSAQKSFGFTLVELMVVITILGILSAIGLVVFTSLQPAARDSRRIEDMQESRNALEQYYATNRSYPDDVPGAGGGYYFINAFNNTPALSTYFQNFNSSPRDPNFSAGGGFGYKYFKCPTAEKYILCTKLEQPQRANRGTSTVPASSNDGCSPPSNAVIPASFYCVGSLSN